MRFKNLAALAASAAMAFAATQASATDFTVSWTLDYAQNDPGLVIEIIPLNQNFSFSLAPDDPMTAENEEVAVIPLFKIYTNEGSVESDDWAQKDITLTFNFSQPLPNDSNAVVGFTGGINLLLAQWGYLDWNPSDLGSDAGFTQLNYGVGDPRGLLTIGVNGGYFNKGLFSLDEGPGKGLIVYGTFDWDRDPVSFGAVPEPATWALMIGGFGLAGAALRRRRSGFAA